jgi:two-component sensor histidine kinase
MTIQSIDIREILDSLPQPALLTTAKGIVDFANRAAQTDAGRSLCGYDLCSINSGDVAALRTFLKRCSGSTGQLVGSIVLPNKEGNGTKYRCYGNLLRSSPSSQIMLRCLNVEDNRFSLLTHRIESLNGEVRRHLHTQAILKQSLAERELLVREIHHRVKNNIQMLLGMLAASAREAHNTETKAVLEDVGRRLGAMGAVQQALYASDKLTHYPADKFFSLLLHQLRQTFPSALGIRLAVEPLSLPSDVSVPLALITNELVTNAIKHGRRSESDADIKIGLRLDDNHVELSVEDNGPGFALGAIEKRSSGLGLVRGLARQLGGSFRVDCKNGGTRCVLSIPEARLNTGVKTDDD